VVLGLWSQKNNITKESKYFFSCY